VFRARSQIQDILAGRDPRLLLIAGPCSIHNLDEGHEYARRLHAIREAVQATLFLVMRVYFEKPRTVVGWKGFINDPFMDDSFRMDEGLRRARRFLLELARMGVPAGTEAVDPITPQYIGDLIAWTAIGARTTESQTHREMASGLSTPVGFKNATDGNIEAAVNAVRSTLSPHHFLGITKNAQCAVFRTRGNRYAHLVLRGGPEPNFDAESIRRCGAALAAAGLPANIVIDCSHGNSAKDPARQPDVLRQGIAQILDGNTSICGFMLESYLQGGQQPIPADPSQLKPGVSVTDACMDWDTTETLLREADRALRETLPRRRR
jgi:3-deoxy-7-phosphoheptulonate synthase